MFKVIFTGNLFRLSDPEFTVAGFKLKIDAWGIKPEVHVVGVLKVG